MPLLILPVLSGLVVLMVFVAHRYSDSSTMLEMLDREFVPTLNSAVGAGLMLVATGLFFATARGWRLGLLALVAFTFVDLSLYGLRHKTTGDFDEFLAEIDVPPGEVGTAFEPDYLPTTNIMGPLMMGYRTSAGRPSIKATRHLEYYLDETSLRLSGVEWLKTRIGTTDELNRLAEAGIEWIEVPDPMPRARLITQARTSRDPAADLDSIDIGSTALVEDELNLDAGPAGTAEMVEDRPGRLLIRTDALTRQLLVLTESYYPGWRVTRNGEPAEALRVYGDFLGCIVEAGEEDVRFVFDPDSWRFGKLISAGSVLLAVVFHIGLFGRLVRRRPFT